MLTAVYLAGVLLPCLVTALTVAKEIRPSLRAQDDRAPGLFRRTLFSLHRMDWCAADFFNFFEPLLAMQKIERKLPVTVLSGFLGSGQPSSTIS